MNSINMKNLIKSFTIAIAIVLSTFSTSPAQQPSRAPDYRIASIKIVPFDEASGEFQTEFTKNSDRAFFNDLSISLFVTFEISGEAGTFEDGRNIVISITEGKKTKFAKTEQVGLIGEGGKYYVPVFLYSAMCDEIKITAKLSGQKTASSMSRTVPFMCGE